MFKRASALFALTLLVSFAFAKDKNKTTLPAYVLRARTVAVIIDPGAGMSIDDPRANQDAQKDVETALLNWGRFEPVLDRRSADLIIVVRKGSGRPVDETIPDARQNNRSGVINPTDNGVQMGGQRGSQPDLSGGPAGPNQPSPQPQMEMGEADDSFTVFQGNVDKPLDAPPAWRYVARDGLGSRAVPAVAAFKKAVEAADKAAAKKP